MNPNTASESNTSRISSLGNRTMHNSVSNTRNINESSINPEMSSIIDKLVDKYNRLEADLVEAKRIFRRIDQKRGEMKNLMVQLNSIKSKIIDGHHAPTEKTNHSWLREVRPKKSPYFPQIGDRVVYITQAHQDFLYEVEEQNLYIINKEDEPWEQLDVESHEVGEVISISYETLPPRICNLELRLRENGRPTDAILKVKYHEMQNSVDFLVLQDDYYASIQRNWSVGSRFKHMAGDEWLFGEILNIQPFQQTDPLSQYKRYHVLMDDGSERFMSSWEIEYTDRLSVLQINEKVPVLPNDIQKLLPHPCAGDWPSKGRDASCQKICESLDKIMELNIVKPFLDLCDDEIYCSLAEYPVDFATIMYRLNNLFYRRFKALEFDVNYLFDNIKKMEENYEKGVFSWEKGTNIFKSYKTIKGIFVNILENPWNENYLANTIQSLTHWEAETATLNEDYRSESTPSVNSQIGRQSLATQVSDILDVIGPAEETVRGNSDVVETVEENSNVIENIERQDDGNANRNISEQENSEFDWLEACKELFHRIWNDDDSIPFRHQMCTEKYPDYRKVITAPTDLQEVHEYLVFDVYRSPFVFKKEMDLIFNNSRQYFKNENEEIYQQTTRLKNIYDPRMKEIIDTFRLKKSKKSPSKRKLEDDTNDNSSIGSNDSPTKAKRQSISVDEAGPSNVLAACSQESDFNPGHMVRRRINVMSDDEDDDDVPNNIANKENSSNVNSVTVNQADDDPHNNSNPVNDSKEEEQIKVTLTSSEDLEKIRPEQFVKLTAKVEEYSKVDTYSGHIIFSFLLKNDEGKTVRCRIWDDNIKKNEAKIKRNRIITVENAISKPITKYNTGNANFELLISANTRIHVVTKAFKRQRNSN